MLSGLPAYLRNLLSSGLTLFISRTLSKMLSGFILTLTTVITVVVVLRSFLTSLESTSGFKSVYI
jgi:hypothetical protein